MQYGQYIHAPCQWRTNASLPDATLSSISHILVSIMPRPVLRFLFYCHVDEGLCQITSENHLSLIPKIIPRFYDGFKNRRIEALNQAQQVCILLHPVTDLGNFLRPTQCTSPLEPSTQSASASEGRPSSHSGAAVYRKIMRSPVKQL